MVEPQEPEIVSKSAMLVNANRLMDALFES